jgi:hypothetical protein
MWDELTHEEQLNFLIELCGTSSGYPTIDHELVFLCEAVLNTKQRREYVDHMSGTIADHTYRRIDPEHPDAATQYYFNMMHAAVELRAKMIWCAATGNEP